MRVPDKDRADEMEAFVPLMIVTATEYTFMCPEQATFSRAPLQRRHGSEDPLSPPPGCPAMGHFPSGTLCRPGGSSRSCRRLACTYWMRNSVSPYIFCRINQCSVGVSQHRVLTVSSHQLHCLFCQSLREQGSDKM